jgi:hypothetical protein
MRKMLKYKDAQGITTCPQCGRNVFEPLVPRTVDPGVAGSNPVGLALFARCQQMAAGDFFSRLLNSGRRLLDQRSSALGGVLARE